MNLSRTVVGSDRTIGRGAKPGFTVDRPYDERKRAASGVSGRVSETAGEFSRNCQQRHTGGVFLIRIGSSIFLIALGAILAFAIRVQVSVVDLVLVGYILMAVGVIGLIASLVLAAPRRQARVSESRSVVDPNTGETITRRESRDTGL